MRYAVVGDIHANWDAFGAVLADIESRDIGRILCVGDIVGYGAQPRRCVSCVQEMGITCVAGNHDHAVIGRLDISYFNHHAREAVEWTRRHLSVSHAEYMARLRLTDVVDGFTIGHGTIHRPEAFGYIETVFAAQLSFDAMTTQIAFLGHSHVPLVLLESKGQDPVTHPQSTLVELGDAPKAIVNVGSVGQPRDDDPRSCYVVYDAEARTVEFRRIAYDIESAQAKIRKVGLPDILAARLELGR